MKSKLWMTAALMAGLMGTACEPKEKEKKQVTVSVNAQMLADDLTAAGEQLIGPFTFHLADRAFEMALERDSGNKKALFYRQFLKRFMTFRGILERVKPLAREHGNASGLQKTIDQLPNHPLRSFLLDASSKTPIRNAEDVQKFLREYQDAVNSFREYALQNQEQELDLYMNPSIFEERISANTQSSCRAVAGESGFDVTCDFRDIATVKINIADMIALRQMAAGEVLYYSMLTAYSIAGTESLWKEIEESNRLDCESSGGYWDNEAQVWVPQTSVCQRRGREIPQKEIYERLAALPGFGRLNERHTLGLVRELGADFSRAAKWVMDHQRSLCPHGVQSDDPSIPEALRPKQRRGFLVENGLCLDGADEARRSLALFDQMLAGVVRQTVESPDGESFETDVNVMALFDTPVADLRRLFPASWSRCGTAETLTDKTFGGLYPSGDAERIMIERCQ